MTENISSKHQNTRARFAFWSSVIMTVAGLVLSVYRVFLITTSPVGDWRDYASLALTGSLCVMGLVSVWLSGCGRATLGISLLIGIFLVMLLLIPALQSGLGFLCGVCAFTITAAIAQQTFPPRAAGRVTVIGGVTGVAALLIDLSWPLERQASSETLITLGIILASTTILIYSFIVVRQFTNYALGTKFALGFLVITLIAVASGFLSLNTYASVDTEVTLLVEDVVPGGFSLLETQAALGGLLKEVGELVREYSLEPIEESLEYIEIIQAHTAEHTAHEVHIGEEEGAAAQDMEDRAASIIGMAQQVIDTAEEYHNMQAEMDNVTEQIDDDAEELLDILAKHVAEHKDEVAAAEAAVYQALAAGDQIDEEFGLLAEDIMPAAVSMMGTQAALGGLLKEVGELVREYSLEPIGESLEYIEIIQTNTAEYTAHEVRIDEKEGAVAQDMEDRAASIIGMAQQVIDTAEEYHNMQSEMDNVTEQIDDDAEELLDIMTEHVAEHKSELATTEKIVNQATTTGNTVAWVAMIVAVVLALGVGFLLTRAIAGPIVTLTTAVKSIDRGDLDVVAVVKSGDEIGVLARAFNSMTARLQSRTRDVEQRTRDVEQRSAYLEGSADISRAAASVLDPDALIRQVVDLIKERFELYYVGLFLVDERYEWAVLQAGTGEAGRKMLARSHRLKIGEGMIGWSIANAEARIALDVGEDAVRFENPDLPETRSEGALPLRSRGRVLGALTIQSTEEAAFDQDIITTLQTMSDQIAVALDNAELLAQSEAALEAERRAYGELSHDAWVTLSQRQAVPGYLVTAEGAMHPIKRQQTSQETQAALHTGPIIQDDSATAVIPIKSHGYVLGGIKIRKSNANDTWTQAEVELVETLSEQISVALESARLYQDTQRRAAHEQMISEATARMRETLDVESVLQAAAKEFRNVLGIDAAEVWIEVDDE